MYGVSSKTMDPFYRNINQIKETLQNPFVSKLNENNKTKKLNPFLFYPN